jgi:SET domain-containing protein
VPKRSGATAHKSRPRPKPVVEPTAPLKKIERRKSKIAGWGVYALEPITKNSRIVHYAGEKISWKESDKREKKYLKKGCIWCFILNRRWVRDAAVGGNIARFINHKCKPNCYTEVVGDMIWIRAARNIRKGEELTYSYETEGGAGIPCLCRPGCKTVL